MITHGEKNRKYHFSRVLKRNRIVKQTIQIMSTNHKGLPIPNAGHEAIKVIQKKVSVIVLGTESFINLPIRVLYDDQQKKRHTGQERGGTKESLVFVILKFKRSMTKSLSSKRG